jgi:hypothetical protein
MHINDVHLRVTEGQEILRGIRWWWPWASRSLKRVRR